MFHYGAGGTAYPPGSPLGGDRNQLAGFWVRFGAWLLDGILYGLVAAPFVGAGVLVGVQSVSDCSTFDDEIVCDPGEFDGGFLALGIAIGAIGIILAVVLYVRALGRTGQPWGARIAGVKVIRSTDGGPPGVGRAFGRSLFAYFISGQVCYLGYLWAIWDGRKQTWHDKVCDTIVVRV